jgi:hypothetical protein
VQLQTVVDPKRLFKDYVYVSGTSPVFVKHFEAYANEVIDRFNLKKDDLVVEIGSNDGTLLKFFKQREIRVLGIDPAKDIASKANVEGIPTINDFFTTKLAADIRRQHGQATVILANNVFAHADDLFGISQGVAHLLHSNGVFVFEVSYLPDVLEHTLFDTIYHEHLSYHSLQPLRSFFSNRLDMRVFDVKHVDTHGGSMRAYVCLSNASYIPSENVYIWSYRELISGIVPPFMAGTGEDLIDSTIFEDFNKKIANLGAELKRQLLQFKQLGKTIAAFGAPAKATTLMYQFDLGPELIDFVVDDSPLKQGLYTPGKHIPVLPSSAMYERKPDAVVILAWNFAESIMAKHQSYLNDGGIFIVPVPSLVQYGHGSVSK